ncbi:hypothetical protein [Pseudoalteromonas sp. G4]|uniref:hypothetical protein n=1 Tax=Pseudoalteromonas sp. G4 TaxID=2992761 RepID=UPI00237E458C|nr:hypothetical protein [Pseudoalteromonas sp. G4]MDE3272719.1 hypothetical protein [Pseudoalteromonas sp. G4]
MRSWIIILFGLVASGYFTDVYSDSTIQAIVCPLIFTLLIIISIIKAAINPSFATDRSSADSSGFLGGGGFMSGSGSSSGSSDCSGGGGDC